MKRQRTQPTKAQLAALQALWYRKLKATGFKDIEQGKDLNKYSTSSFHGQTEEDHGLEFVSTSSTSGGHAFDATELFLADNRAFYGAETAVANTPQALLWRKISRAVHDLPSNRKHRGFLIAWSETGQLEETRRRFGFTRAKARWIVDSFCKCHEIDNRRLYSSASGEPVRRCRQPMPTISPTVRRLSKREIARLPYTPPLKKSNGSND